MLLPVLRATAADCPPHVTVADAPVLPPSLFGKGLQMAVELFNDGLYSESRVEAMRVMAEKGGVASADYADALLVRDISSFMLGADPAKGESWKEESGSLSARISAAYIAGVFTVADSVESRRKKMEALAFVFTRTDDTPLFWNSGCLLYLMLKSDKEAREKSPLLWKQLDTASTAWPVEVVRSCRENLERKGEQKAPLPIRVMISFYRRQISPAIGKRCLVEPSCSEYYLQACRKHGWLGMGIGGDRFFREPEVTGDYRLEVIMPDRSIRFADPLSAHDFWLK